MKKIICGMIIGMMLMSGMVFAAQKLTATKANYPILVNGVKVNAEPVSINGKTYVPLKAIGQSLGVAVNWNKEKRQVEIGQAPVVEQQGSINTGEVEIKIVDVTIVSAKPTLQLKIKNLKDKSIEFDPRDMELKCAGQSATYSEYNEATKTTIEAGSTIDMSVAYISDIGTNVYELAYKSYKTKYLD